MSATRELHELGQSIWLDNVGIRCRPTAATPRPSWPTSAGRAWTSIASPRGFSPTGAKSFVDSWNDLMAHIDQQSVALSA